MIEIFGADVGGVPVEPGHREARRDGVTFGARLEVRLAVADQQGGKVAAAAEAREACGRAGVDLEQARARTRELAATSIDIGAREALDAALASMTKATPPKPAKPRERVMSREEQAERAAGLDRVRSLEIKPRALKPADLKRAGYTARRRGEGWTLYHGEHSRKCSDAKCDRSCRARPLAVDSPNEDAAWNYAASQYQTEPMP